MAPATRRRFTILDGMILVAAVAFGFALRRTTDAALGDFSYDANWLGRKRGKSVADALPFLVTFTLAVFLMRLRRPRPRWRRIFRQPGMAACCAAIVPIAFAWLRFAFARSTRDPASYWDALPDNSLLRQGVFLAGLWVLAAWLTLILSGRQRPERSRLDRLGRIIGLGWLLVLVIGILGSMLYPEQGGHPMNINPSPIRRLDRLDGLILVTSTFAAILAASILPGPVQPVPLAPTAPMPMLPTVPMPVPPALLGPAPPLGPSVATRPDDDPPAPILDLHWNAQNGSWLLLTAWSAAFLMMRGRRPRPPWRKLASQPGLAACGFGALVLAAQLAAIFIRWSAIWLWTAIVYRSLHQSWMYFHPRPPTEILVFWIREGFIASASAGHAIAAIWLIMILGGWWRPEKSGIDRLGRALGAAWIVLMVAGEVAG